MKLFELRLLTLTEASKIEYVVGRNGDKIVAAARRDNGSIPENVNVEDAKSVVGYIEQILGDDFTVWAVNMYLKGQFKLEDVTGNIKETVDQFKQQKRNLEKKDINAYKTLPELYTALDAAAAKTASTEPGQKEKDRQAKVQGAETLFSGPNFKVVWTKTFEANKIYGKNTKWCTTHHSGEQFAHYNSQGPLYVIIAGDRKFQYHYESGQFKQEQDQEIGKADIDYLSKYPEYKEFLNWQIRLHYFPEDATPADKAKGPAVTA